ncbi:MAG: glycosyltransferase family 4 protein [Eubacteriales bacterium]|nr:glycosyltransferase family 4 protein [Eubacteriales bacterium]
MEKIVLVNPWVLPVPGVKGGAIESLIDILIDQNEIYHRFDFIVISIYDKDAERVAEKYKYTQFIYIKSTFISKFLQRLYGILKYHFFKWDIHWLFRYYYIAIKHIKNILPELVIVEGGMYEQFTQLSNIIPKERMVAYLHSEVYAGDEEYTTFGNAFAISEFIKERWCSNGKFSLKNVSVIHNVVDEDIFRIVSIESNEIIQLKKELNIDLQKFVLLYSGRIIPEKGVLELVNAVKDMKNVELVIVGGTNFADSKSTSYLECVKKVISKTDNIHMVGYKPKAVIPLYYSIADVVCVPSLWQEPAALVTIEAMLMSKPLIVTNVGGMVEYVDKDSAIIVENDNNIINSLKNAVKFMMEDKKKLDEMSRKAYERGMLFTKKKYYDEFCDRCCELIYK